MPASNYNLEYYTIEASNGIKLEARIFTPKDSEYRGIKDNLAIVLVHPYSILGGCQVLLMGIAGGLATEGYKAVTFDMRGVGKSTGKASIRGSEEVQDVVDVCRWVSENLNVDEIVLVGSSAGAPIAGSAVDKVKQVVGYVSLGYPFGLMASILFGRHHKAILRSPKPKLFVMGTKDCFTSVKQLKNKLTSSSGHVEAHLVEGVGHFEMEGPAYDDRMVNLILRFIESL